MVGAIPEDVRIWPFNPESEPAMDRPSTEVHDRDLAEAFDGQAARFEKAPVQTDPAALGRLVRAADLPADSLVLDAGCGPGLVGSPSSRPGIA